MKTRILLTLLLCLNVFNVGAQAIAGRWEGNYSGFFSALMRPEKLVVDLMVARDTIVSGSSHLYYSGGKYEHYRVTGVFHPKDSTVWFSEDSTIAKNISMTCLGNYRMRLFIKGNVMRLEGRWKDNSDGFALFGCPSSGVWLERKLPVAAPAKPAIDVEQLSRKPDIQQLIEVSQAEKDSISIELLDNAQIDNDVVSVYLNDSLVLPKQKLGATPVRFYLKLSRENQICRIKMAAESMGAIPPCTALMIVTTKEKQYHVTLSSDFGNNGTLEFFLKE